MTCLCTKKICFCCLARLSSCAKETNANALEKLVVEHTIPGPFCQRDLSQCSELATAILSKDDDVRKQLYVHLVDINKLKRKVAELQNQNLDLKESVENERLQKEENETFIKKPKSSKKD